VPIINDDEIVQFGASHFTFSAVKPETLQASEYTLATIIFDVSGSMYPYANELATCVQKILDSLKYSPRVDNLLLRVVRFGSHIEEFHGFKPLSSCNSGDYTNIYANLGLTALLDAIGNGVKATEDYALQLIQSDYSVNGIVIIVTDDEENHSSLTKADVAKCIQSAVTQERIDSVKVILVTANDSVDHTQFCKDVGAHQHINIGAFSPRKLAQLADFVSKSVSSQSQALGTNGNSVNLVF